MDDTTNQFDDDVDARLKEPTQTNKEVVQGEGADAEMNDAQQGNENLETTQEQVINDAHVKISNVTKKTEKILIDKMEKSKSYLVAPEQRDFYDSLKKYYNLDKDFFFSYDVYSLKRGRKDKDKDEDPSTDLPRVKEEKDNQRCRTNTDSNMPQDQEGNPGDNDDEPKKEDASRCDWFKKPIPPQEPTDPDWHEGKTLQKGPTQK
ncbi:hypothetical protein Tco_1548394 [Tanacetum coccineum]